MTNKYDEFEDFTDTPELGGGGGILDSAGLNDYEGVQTKIVGADPRAGHQGGAGVTLNCRRCNNKRQIIIEWPELVIISMNNPSAPPFLPKDWKFSEANRTAYIACQCPVCGAPEGFAPHMTPGEAQMHVTSGEKSGLLHPGMAEQLRQQVRVARGGR